MMAGEHFIRGLSNADIRYCLESSGHLRDLVDNPKKQSAKVNRILSRFHTHKLIAKIPRSRRWRVTDRAKQIMAASLSAQSGCAHHCSHQFRPANRGAAGAFRDDLYYRLNVIVIKIPPLRERTEDIPLLPAHFVRKYGEEGHRKSLYLDPAAMKILVDYDWSGNVRELENVIERAVALSTGDRISADLFPKNIIMPIPEAPVRFTAESTSLKERVGNNI